MKVINGIVFKQMLVNSLNNLYSSENEINRMNVFPVPDGDTGTNMLLTLENGLNGSPATENLSEFLEALSRGMLYGARGNSGVILSQIFKGISVALAGLPEMQPKDFALALKEGARNAYLAVMNLIDRFTNYRNEPQYSNVRILLHEDEIIKSPESKFSEDIYLKKYKGRGDCMPFLNTPSLV